MQHGPLEETMIRRARVNRSALPAHIRDAAQMLPGEQFYFQSFLALSSCRPVGMGEGRIPWLAVFQYAEALHLSEEEFSDLWVLVSFMDAEYLKYRQKQLELKTRQPTPQS